MNLRINADEDAVRTLGALAGFAPRLAPQIESLELVEDLIVDLADGAPDQAIADFRARASATHQRQTDLHPATDE